jgi:hypothetical protein
MAFHHARDSGYTIGFVTAAVELVANKAGRTIRKTTVTSVCDLLIVNAAPQESTAAYMQNLSDGLAGVCH